MHGAVRFSVIRSRPSAAGASDRKRAAARATPEVSVPGSGSRKLREGFGRSAVQWIAQMSVLFAHANGSPMFGARAWAAHGGR